MVIDFLMLLYLHVAYDMFAVFSLQ